MTPAQGPGISLDVPALFDHRNTEQTEQDIKALGMKIKSAGVNALMGWVNSQEIQLLRALKKFVKHYIITLHTIADLYLILCFSLPLHVFSSVSYWFFEVPVEWLGDHFMLSLGFFQYWKLRLDSLTRDYKRLSRIFAHRFSIQPDDHELLTRVNIFLYFLLGGRGVNKFYLKFLWVLRLLIVTDGILWKTFFQ